MKLFPFVQFLAARCLSSFFCVARLRKPFLQLAAPASVAKVYADLLFNLEMLDFAPLTPQF
jgi:hypothetical protein